MRISDWSSDVCSSDLEVARPASTNKNITQFLVKTSERTKRETLRNLIEEENVATAIIFCNRKTTVRELAKSLQRYRYRAGEIHGDMDQSSRIAELNRFKNGDINILVASDVAARDRKSTRRTPVTNAHLVCRLLLEKKKTHYTEHK